MHSGIGKSGKQDANENNLHGMQIICVHDVYLQRAQITARGVH
jgi:hypothetical protein